MLSQKGGVEVFLASTFLTVSGNVKTMVTIREWLKKTREDTKQKAKDTFKETKETYNKVLDTEIEDTQRWHRTNTWDPEKVNPF